MNAICVLEVNECLLRGGNSVVLRFGNKLILPRRILRCPNISLFRDVVEIEHV